jgi:hypothetical protein
MAVVDVLVTHPAGVPTRATAATTDGAAAAQRVVSLVNWLQRSSGHARASTGTHAMPYLLVI